ncbi:hypothetical protein I204_05461 [Kwoniella mangroviensis CBS 8886]|uniref:uncharacterized protein n=1 Tax=Kwoniella mangroviensis CBS 8507 TaxID=1296122 RepID=UPI00080D1330|nr:uncharacterized protein I203_07617 [Kwoniella mangroviensis CBS 8507]OCF63193.1 hypothetical protein I203_07617 [Kwoniella mangroviensis CBS 8507]OCF73618.1 hypothetical protein I204_05461 [Kwoniella mangroviensis CBS 8886]
MKRVPPSYTSSSDNDIDNSSSYSPSLGESQDIRPIFSSPPISARSTPKKPKLDNENKGIKSKTPSPKKSKMKSESGSSAAASAATGTNVNGVWDGDKRALFVDEIIAVGYKNANLDELANKLGMSKRQLIDQLVPNKSNLRGKW